ncbi:MAG: Asp23/Gls24 family envelope stress response protein [Schaalia odontolytica]|nr:Asp23/Gls24 family envelope stress response protein [Schaalia odontolytica]MDU5761128.1 Asp23/Gls24 family envelope stress response protein [Schaalia odontolytica]
MSKNTIPQTGQQRERNENVEEEKTLRGPLQTEHGVTTIDENVVAKIAGMAAREVPGVYDMGNAVRRAFSAVTDRIPNAQTNVAGGVSVQKGETQAAIEITIVIDYGVSIVEVSNAIRRNVIEQLEGTTGLEVVEVNINVTDVHLPDEDADDSEPADLK